MHSHIQQTGFEESLSHSLSTVSTRRIAQALQDGLRSRARSQFLRQATNNRRYPTSSCQFSRGSMGTWAVLRSSSVPRENSMQTTGGCSSLWPSYRMGLIPRGISCYFAKQRAKTD